MGPTTYNQPNHSTEGQWLVDQLKGQSHQAQLRLRKGRSGKSFYYNYIQHHTEDTEALGR